jgi:hypothetical protein
MAGLFFEAIKFSGFGGGICTQVLAAGYFSAANSLLNPRHPYNPREENLSIQSHQ